MIDKHTGEKEELQDILLAMDQEFTAADSETKLQFQNLRDELQSKSLEDLSNLNAKLQGRIRQLEKAFDQVSCHFQPFTNKELNNYNNQTEGRISKLHQKTNQDEQNTKTIQFNNRKLMRLQKSLAHWRTKITNNSKECDQRNKALKEVFGKPKKYNLNRKRML